MNRPLSGRVGVSGAVASLVGAVLGASCRGPLPPEPADAVPGEQPATTLVEVGAPAPTASLDAGPEARSPLVLTAPVPSAGSMAPDPATGSDAGVGVAPDAGTPKALDGGRAPRG